MKYLASITMLVLTGCTTVEFVRKDLTPAKLAVLRYPPQSNAADEEKYRTQLSQKSKEFCGGDFKIVKEYEALEKSGDSGMRTGIGTGFGVGGGGGIFIGGSSGSSERTYHFVEIACAVGGTP